MAVANRIQKDLPFELVLSAFTLMGQLNHTHLNGQEIF